MAFLNESFKKTPNQSERKVVYPSSLKKQNPVNSSGDKDSDLLEFDSVSTNNQIDQLMHPPLKHSVKS